MTMRTEKGWLWGVSAVIRRPCGHLEDPAIPGNPRLENGRDGEIRTLDLLLPKQALYQAKLRPDFRLKGGHETPKPGA
jgi:hypothetical protein